MERPSSTFSPHVTPTRAVPSSQLSLYLNNPRGFIGIAAVFAASVVVKAVLSDEFIASVLSTPLGASLWDLFWAFLFVGSIYFWKYNEAWTPELRDRLHVVWQRFTSITVVCACFVFLTPLSWTSIGLSSSIIQHLSGAIIGVLLSAILYAGPLFYAYLAPEEELITKPEINWLTFRNIAFAPIMEEIAFRMCMVPIMLHAGLSATTSVFVTPLFFGAAHVHHILNDTGRVITLKLAGKKINIKVVYINAIVQASYTSVFGFFASYLFIQTGTIFAPIFSHAFCNFMELPPTDFLSHPKGKLIAVAYVVGLVSFWVLMGPLTSLPVFAPLSGS